MRQRKVRNLDEKLKTVESYYLEATYAASADGEEESPRHDRWGQEARRPCEQRGSWRDLFAASAADPDPQGRPAGGSAASDTRRPLYAELGCGKGRFLVETARRHPENLYLGIEGHQGVLLRAAQHLDEIDAGNARLLCAYVHDIRDIFGENELDGLYLNFSDPWPKARHEKRRLTHRNYLATYREVVREGGFLAFKTDNDDLFEFTLEEIAAEEYDILEMSRDLHSSEYAADNVMTEYEEKFSGRGKTINYVKIAL